MRYFNISDTALSARLSSLLPIQQAWLTDLNGTRLQAITPMDAHTLTLKVSSHQVITLEMHFLFKAFPV